MEGERAVFPKEILVVLTTGLLPKLGDVSSRELQTLKRSRTAITVVRQ